MHFARDITVVVADLPGPSRAALAGLIASAPDLRLAAEVSTRAELEAVVNECRPDVVLLDDRLLRDTTLHAARFDAAFVITGVDDDPAYADRARRIGASGWVAKEQPDDVLEALRAAGRTTAPAAVATTS